MSDAQSLSTIANSLAGIAGLSWLMKKLLGPSVEATGVTISEVWKQNVLNNWSRIETQVEKKAIEKNVVLGSLPLKVVKAIYEASSEEDNESVQDLWANLIINMASSSERFNHTIYPYLLTQISLEEWKCLSSQYIKIAEITELTWILRPYSYGNEPRALSLQTIESVQVSEVDTLSEIRGILNSDSLFNSQNLLIDYLSKRSMMEDRLDLSTFSWLIECISRRIDDKLLTPAQIQNLVRLGLIEQSQGLRGSVDIGYGEALKESNYSSVALSYRLLTGVNYNISPLAEDLILCCA